MTPKIYTIGYSAYPRDEFIKILKQHGISVLIDVRSSPYSAFHPEYNKEALEIELKKNHIYYRNYKKEFGARQEDMNLYSPEGYLDFEKFAKTEIFQNGIKKLHNSMEQGYSPVLMCAEKNPIDCHRAILISRAFQKDGCRVIHILSDKRTCTQEDISGALLDKYFPNREQISLFGNSTDESLIEEAYRKRNAEIGYKITEEGEP